MRKELVKKTWIKPELTVILRGTSEESVLLGCKCASSNGGPGAPPCHSEAPIRCNIGATS